MFKLASRIKPQEKKKHTEHGLICFHPSNNWRCLFNIPPKKSKWDNTRGQWHLIPVIALKQWICYTQLPSFIKLLLYCHFLSGAKKLEGLLRRQGVWDSCKPHVSVIRYYNCKASSTTEPKCCNSWGISRQLLPWGLCFFNLSIRSTADFKFNLKRRDEWETVAIAGWYTIPTNESVHLIHLWIKWMTLALLLSFVL